MLLWLLWILCGKRMLDKLSTLHAWHEFSLVVTCCVMMCDANQCHEPCCAKQALLFIHVSQDCAMLPLMTHASHAKVETPRVENRKRVYQVHVFFWITIHLWCLVLVCPRTCLLSPFPRFSQSMHQSMHQCLFQDSKHPACSPEPDLASLILRLWRFCQSKFLLFIVRPSPVCDVWEHMRTIMEKTWMNQLSSLTMSMVRFECRTWPMSCLVIWL